MQETITYLKEHWDDILAIYGAVVLVSTTIVKLTPSTKDDEILGKIIRIFDFFSTAFTKADAKVLDDAKANLVNTTPVEETKKEETKVE